MTASLVDLVREELRALEAYQIPHPRGVRAKLDANESPWRLPEEVAAELGAVLAGVALNRYPDGAAAELREIVARDLGCAPGQLVFGNGSDELIALLVSTFCRARPGGGHHGRIAYPVPSFVVYRIATLAAGASPLEIPLREDFTLDPVAVERAVVAGRPNLIFFALPNNPTGTLWPREEVLRLAERHRDTIVVADEAYFDYADETVLGELPRHPNLIVMRTLSKMGLAGLRVGFMTAAEPLLHQVEKIRPPYNLGALNQAAAGWLLANRRDLLREQTNRVVAERDRLTAALAEVPGAHVFPTRANFVLLRWGEPGDGRATELWHTLATRGVLVRNFDRPGPLSGCLRVTVGTPEENDLLLAAIRG